MKKPISILLVLLVIFACNKPDKPVPSVDQVDPLGMEDDDSSVDDGQVNETSMLSINLEGVSGLELSALSIESANGSAEVNTNGQMENIVDNDNPDLPIIFTKESNVIMGYFPETLTNGEVKIHDVI